MRAFREAVQRRDLDGLMALFAPPFSGLQALLEAMGRQLGASGQ